MNQNTLILTLALTACAGSPSGDDQGFAEAAAPPVADPARLVDYSGGECSALPLSAFEDLQDLVDQSYDQAEADAAANGVTGRYPVAATTGFDHLGDARDELDELMVRIGDWTSTTRTRGQAYAVAVPLKSVIDHLTTAGHWESISTVYHDSVEARQAMEGTFSAIEEANGLRATALRCYVGTDGL